MPRVTLNGAEVCLPQQALASRLQLRNTQPRSRAPVKSRALFGMPQLDSCRLANRQFVKFT